MRLQRLVWSEKDGTQDSREDSRHLNHSSDDGPRQGKLNKQMRIYDSQQHTPRNPPVGGLEAKLTLPIVQS